jgi:murein DD-endopeptidase MepM/ murein hydrolase activator NlpD
MYYLERYTPTLTRRGFLQIINALPWLFSPLTDKSGVNEVFDFLPSKYAGCAKAPLPGRLEGQIGNRNYPNDGYQHLEPITLPLGIRDNSHHIGTDFNNGNDDVDMGVKVTTIMDGVCVFSDTYSNRDLGNIVIICSQLPDSSLIYTRYAHLSNISASVGVDYAMGEQIAEVGKSGFENGYCHLHLDIATRELFEYRYRGQFADPRWYPRFAPVEFIERYYLDPVKLITDYQKDPRQHMRKDPR